MFVCFVGKPTVRFGNKWLKMPSGASLETIYNRTAQEARKGSFSGLQLGLNEPFSSVCKHVVLIGYNLTRRAMTAAFTPADEPGVLCKLQYGILTAPKTLTIDALVKGSIVPRTTLETTRCLKLIVSMSRCPRLHSTCAKSFESWKMKWWMRNVAILAYTPSSGSRSRYLRKILRTPGFPTARSAWLN